MSFQALLVVSKDDATVTPLKQVLTGFGLSVQCCSHSGALGRLKGQKFDAVVVDFDDPASAALILQQAYRASSGASAITAALLSDRTKVRIAFRAGANFVLYKPITTEQAEASLRSAIAIMKRERRRSLRVPVQAPVWLRSDAGQEIEGIMLMLSDNGMEVLASQPQAAGAQFSFKFSLPEGGSEISGRCEIAWANPNGQAGVRFVDFAEEFRAGVKKWIATNSQGLPSEAMEPVLQCKLTDLSLGGCYVETRSPFPERAGIVLCLKLSNMEVQCEGVVRVMHPGVGMGIVFASHTQEQRDQVHRFIDFLSSRPGTVPELQVLPGTAGTMAVSDEIPSAGVGEFEDPLLELLRNHEALNQDEFLEELRQQRRTAEVVS
jgi:CheY-like chemotaxis protein